MVADEVKINLTNFVLAMRTALVNIAIINSAIRS